MLLFLVVVVVVVIVVVVEAFNKSAFLQYWIPIWIMAEWCCPFWSSWGSM